MTKQEKLIELIAELKSDKVNYSYEIKSIAKANALIDLLLLLPKEKQLSMISQQILRYKPVIKSFITGIYEDDQMTDRVLEMFDTDFNLQLLLIGDDYVSTEINILNVLFDLYMSITDNVDKSVTDPALNYYQRMSFHINRNQQDYREEKKPIRDKAFNSLVSGIYKSLVSGKLSDANEIIKRINMVTGMEIPEVPEKAPEAPVVV